MYHVPLRLHAVQKMPPWFALNKDFYNNNGFDLVEAWDMLEIQTYVGKEKNFYLNIK